ncbi:MAG: GNAT family N-acetyltransferase [Bacteroidetes bacterium]|nr:GNAT family N-acetyltransferase [Bacteroidota bacterium]
MIKIIRATTNDTNLISEVGKISFLESHGISGPDREIKQYVEQAFSLEAIAKELEDKKNNYFILYYNNQIAGYSNIIYNATNPKIESKFICKLDRLYVLKEFHGLKLGTALFEFNIQQSLENLQTGIWLYVWTGNKPALGFYKKAGLEIIASTTFKITENHSNPNYWMYRRF